MENNLETPTPELGVEETTQNQQGTAAPDIAEPEKAEQSKDLQSALAQKEHFRTKLEKVEVEKRALEEKLRGGGQGNIMPIDPLEVVKLGKALNQYDESEVDFIIRNASDKSPEGIIRASKDEWVSTAIQAKREKVEKSKKIPSPSGIASGEFLEERGTREIAKMSDEEYAKYREKLVAREEQRGQGI